MIVCRGERKNFSVQLSTLDSYLVCINQRQRQVEPERLVFTIYVVLHGKIMTDVPYNLKC